MNHRQQRKETRWGNRGRRGRENRSAHEPTNVRHETGAAAKQQRGGIARALAQQPRILLADEPVASLDPGNAEQVMALLQRICREDGLTAIVSLHQLDLAKTFAQRIVALQGGRVVFDGAPGALDEAVVERVYRSPAATTAKEKIREERRR